MDKEKLLDEYINECFADCKPITLEERKHIANTFGFERYCLAVAWEEFKEGIKGTFPFNLLFGRNNP